MILTLDTKEAVRMLLEDESAKWSENAAAAIVNHLESVEEDTGNSIEFDRVAIRCDYSEYASAKVAASAYGEELDEVSALRWLDDRTTVIPFTGGVLILQF